jgi:drug/metabolite transporter (DMT)-like permease
MALKGRSFLTYAGLAALVLIWGSTWAAIRVSLEGIPPLLGVVLRFTLAGALLLALAPVLGVRLGRSAVERRLWWVNALLTFTAAYSLINWAEMWMPSGLAAVLFATFPLFVAVMAHFFIPGERLRKSSLAGVLIGFIGVAVLFSEDLRAVGGSRTVLAAVLMLLSALSSAVAYVAVKRWGTGIHPLSISGVSMGLGALLAIPLAWMGEQEKAISFGMRPVLALVYLAVVGSALAFSIYYWLLRRLPATTLSLINYATPVVAVLIGTLWLGEPFTLRIFLGALLVVAGVAIAVR